MSFRFPYCLRFVVLLILTTLLPTACRRNSSIGVERIAILHFDNLTGDAQWNWLSAAAPSLWRAQLSGSQSSVANVVKSPSEAAQLRATRLLTGYFSVRAGLLRGTLTVVDTESGRTQSTILVQAGDAIALLNQISTQLQLPVRPLPTQALKSLEAYGQGLAASSQSDAVAHLKDATAVDPSFGLAWIQLIDRMRGRGDIAGSLDTARLALVQKSIPAVERADLGLRALPADASAADRLAQLENISRANPADANYATQTADFAVAARMLPKAVEWYRIATKIMPESAQLWNSKGYAEAFSGDFENAQKSIQRYQAAAPDDANFYDSSGEILFLQGHFAEAAASFQTGFQKLPNAFGANMLRKAAWAHLRSGNVAEADKVFGQYVEFRQKMNDPFIPLRQAQWVYLTGKQDAAKRQLQSFAVEKKNPFAWAQLSIWERFEEHPAKAVEYAQKAMQGLPDAPQYRNTVAIAAVLAQPNAPAIVWKQRMNGQPIAAIGMLVSKEPAEAAQFLEEVRAKINPLQEYYWKDLHAIALYRSGKKAQAKALLTSYSLPEAEEDAVVLCFAFPADQQIRKELGK